MPSYITKLKDALLQQITVTKYRETIKTGFNSYKNKGMKMTNLILSGQKSL